MVWKVSAEVESSEPVKLRKQAGLSYQLMVLGHFVGRGAAELRRGPRSSPDPAPAGMPRRRITPHLKIKQDASQTTREPDNV